MLADTGSNRMEYIEAELKKRRGSSSVDESAEELTRRAKDPHDELYAIAERFKVTNATRRAAGDDGDEGNVTLSAGMLTAIPEVDLGVDVRLRNIEETEKAKQAVISSAKSSEPERGDPGFERCASHPLGCGGCCCHSGGRLTGDDVQSGDNGKEGTRRRMHRRWLGRDLRLLDTPARLPRHRLSSSSNSNESKGREGSTRRTRRS